MKQLLIFLLVILFPLVGWAGTKTVCDSGCDNTTIAAALSALGSGNHTITVQGTYTTEADITVSQSGSGVGTELLIQASGTQLLPKVTITGSYVKLTGFRFVSKMVLDKGNYNIVDGNTWKGTYAALSGIVTAFRCDGCTHCTFQNNTINHWPYDILISTFANSSYCLFYNNTFTDGCSGPDQFRPFGHDHIIRGNTIIDPSYYGKTRVDGETLEEGECRVSATFPPAKDLYWEVTTAGVTGTGEPSGFTMSGINAGDTKTDGGVTWTARTPSGQHADIFQIYGDHGRDVEYSKDILVERNKAYYTQTTNLGDTGSYGSQIGNMTYNGSNNTGWTFRNNVFKLSRAFNLFLPNMTFYNNVFAGNYQNPLALGCDISGCATGATFKNNIFVGNQPGTTWGGWWASIYPQSARQASTAYGTSEEVWPVAGHDGWHHWKALSNCTSGSGGDPAGMTINRSITASVTIDSNTLTNVSSFTGIQISEGLKAIGYIDYRCNVGSWNSGAGTITMETSYPYGPTYCGLQTADGVSIDVIKSCNNSYDKITNKTIELNTTGWTATADATLAQDTGRQVYGLKITAAGSSVGAYQDSSAAAAQVYQVFFDYKNAAGAVAQYAVYDNTNAAWITTATDLDDSTDWTIRKRITFTAPAGCTSARLYLLAKANENVVWFDTISWFEYPHPYPYETVTLQDGTCLWQCTMGKGPVTADYNYVAEGPDLSYIAKTGFTGAKGETHGVSGGNPYFTSYENANFVLTANSTILINAGVDLSTSFTNDILGNARSGAWDIGPYEYGGLPIAPCPVGSTCAMWLR